MTHETFVIERHFGCTPAQAFSAWADPELKRRWFANPGDWPDGKWELDFRVGGGEENGGTGCDGVHHQFRSRFHDIAEDERIIFAYDLLLDHRLISVSLTSVEFLAKGAGTRLLFTEQGVFLDEHADVAGRAHGTGVLLDRLEKFLTGEAVR